MNKQKTEPLCQIGELAEEADVTPRTIRFYEELGLLSPARVNGRRYYGKRELVRLKLALRGRRLGFSFGEIREVFDIYDSIADGKKRQIEKMLEILDAKQSALEERAQEIDAMLGEIAMVRKRCKQSLAEMKRKRKARKKKK